MGPCTNFSSPGLDWRQNTLIYNKTNLSVLFALFFCVTIGNYKHEKIKPYNNHWWPPQNVIQMVASMFLRDFESSVSVTECETNPVGTSQGFGVFVSKTKQCPYPKVQKMPLWVIPRMFPGFPRGLTNDKCFSYSRIVKIVYVPKS